MKRLFSPSRITGVRRRMGMFYTLSVAAAMALLGVAQSRGTETSFTSSGTTTWTCPVGVTSVQVQVWGGGGGGGGVGSGSAVDSGSGANYGEAGGGAGGSYTVTTLTVSPGTVYNLTVGAGGVSGTGGNVVGTAGGAGGTTYFGNSVAGNGSDASVLAVGGSGGNPVTVGGTSKTDMAVSSGATASPTSNNVPSASAVAGGNGGTPVTTVEASGVGGNGGGPGGGSGGAAQTGAGLGVAGGIPGGGASGGLQVTSIKNGNGAGAAGGVGEVALTYGPNITLSGTPWSVNTTPGVASAPTSFSVAGADLTAGITVSAPAGFEISTSSNSGFSSSASVSESGGVASATTVYVRLLSSDAAGSYTGNATAASTGATSVTETIPSSTVVVPLTPGNVVVQQADNGSLNNTTLSLLELSTTATSPASPVQTISFPGSNVSSDPTQSQALRINGHGGTTGYLGNTNDGTLLPIVAANALNNTDYSQSTAANIDNRAVVTLSSSGTIVFEAYYTGNNGVPSTGNQARAASSLDDTNWLVADKGGIYVTSAATETTSTAAYSTTNMLNARSFGGQVYGFSAAVPGVTLVTSSGATIGTLNTLPGSLSVSSYTDFYMVSSGANGAAFDVCYACVGSSTNSGVISKFSLVNGSWVSNGSYNTSFGGRSMVAEDNGTGATLYLTAGDGGESGDNVVEVTDTAPWNSAISVTTGSNVNIYTFPAGPYAKGIAFTPLATPLPDLTIAVSAPSEAATSFDYAITLANSGVANASGVTAQFTLPAGVAYVSGTDNGSNGFAVSGSNGVVTFSGGTLNAGVTDTITVSVTGTLGGNYVVDSGTSPASGHGFAVINTSAITATPIAESNISNNCSEVGASTAITDQPIIGLNLSAPASATLESNFTYSIALSNSGAATASGSGSLAFTLPAGVTYVSGTDTGSGGFIPSYNSSTGVVTFSGGTLGENATDTLTVTVNTNTSTYRIETITLPAGAAVFNPGSVASANTVTTSITLPSGPDLVGSSTPDGAMQPGDSSDAFTIYASNDGTTAESGTVTVTYTLPAGFTFVSGSGSGWTVVDNGQTITATYTGGLQPGAGSSPLTINVSVASNATGALSSTAVVSSTDDAFSGNGSDSNTIQVGAPATYTTAGSLIVTRAHYEGNANTITVGETLPNGSAATVSGAYPYVWGNEDPDVSFGVTAPIYLDVISPTSSLLYSSSVANTTNVTDLIQQQLGMNVTTSFSSKSEIGLHLTPDGSGVTMMGYVAPPNTLDASNANTPYHDDPTSPLATHGDFQHAVIQLNYLGQTQVTPIDAYSGDNSRNVILANASGTNYYYTVGSAGNSGAGVTGTTMSMLAQCTGVQMIQPGAGGLTTAVGEPFGTYGSTTGYQLGYAGQPTDKTGKDMNLRGLTLNPFNNTLYVSKGSGGQGVDTVYQIGSGLPTVTTASNVVFSIPNGLPQPGSSGYYPFGMFFANAYTLYIADEGEAPAAVTYDSGNGTYDEALPANNPNAGLQKWVNSMPDGSGTWSMVYVLQNGLNLGQPYNYTINNYPTGANPVTGVPWQPANNGLRNLAGQINGDGTVTFYSITSTVSGETDWGADPNQLVCISDTVANTMTSATNQSFSVLEVADGYDALRGIAIAQEAPADTSATSSNVTHDGASVGGSLNPNGTDTQVYVQYGTSTAYGQDTALIDLGSGSSLAPFSFNLTGLSANTAYDYRLVVVTGSGTTYYQNQTFTTPSQVPAMQPWMFVAIPGMLLGLAAWSLRRKGMPRIA